LVDRLIQWQDAASTEPASRAAAVAQSNQLGSNTDPVHRVVRDFDTDASLNAVEGVATASEAPQLC